MKFILCAFAIVLSVTVYPITRIQGRELTYIFGLIETDVFNWYRMILVSAFAVFALGIKEWPIKICLALLILSAMASRFPGTVLFGTPMHHEGILALLGYAGVYHLSKAHGYGKALERSLDAVVYITAFIAGLQLYYGNFMNFPLFKPIMADLQMRVETWPIYANMGGPNNLGLFCSLFTPYAIVRKKKVQTVLLFALLIGSQSRFAWFSVLITTALASRRHLLIIALVAVTLSIFRHDILTDRFSKSIPIHWPIQDGDLSGRAYMWKRSIPVLKDSIFLGKGPATYIHYVPQFHERGNAIGFLHHVIDRPHNLFINIWQSSGLLSLLILAYWMRKKLLLANDASLKMGIIGYLIASVFTDSVLCVTPYLSIFLGGINGSNNEARRHDKRTWRSYLGGRSSGYNGAQAILFDHERSSQVHVP